jgi:methylthioribose-1-phosphate isomerase
MQVQVGRRLEAHRTVTFHADQNEVRMIDQRLLPHRFEILATHNYRQTAQAIRSMAVRGAGAIGATAGYGLAQGVRAFRGRDLSRFQQRVSAVFDTLHAARPTAVDPFHAMTEVREVMRSGETVEEQQALALAAAEEFANRNVRECEALGRHGARLIRNGMRVLTHCNAGWLAFVDFGSATAPLYVAQAQGRRFHVFCDETRPRCQGSTLTAWELAQQGVSHQIIADNAAGHLMQRGEIDLVIVGSDRTLGRTGEVANKIGTYTKAVLAARHSIPFYVAIPFSTLDWTLRSGRQIPIEERAADEVLCAVGIPCAAGARMKDRDRASRHRPVRIRIANPTSDACNPGFDVTPAELVTGIITPAGIFQPEELWAQRDRLGKGPGRSPRSNQINQMSRFEI